MKIYFMLKPGFVSKELIEYVKQYVLSPENKCKIVDEGEARYNVEGARKHYDEIYSKYIKSGKKDYAFYPEMEEYLTSGPVYGMIVEFNGTEDEWKKFRIDKIGATRNPAPGTLRYDFTIGLGNEYIVDKNVAHSSDSIAAGEKESEIYYEMRGTSAFEK